MERERERDIDVEVLPLLAFFVEAAVIAVEFHARKGNLVELFICFLHISHVLG